MAFGAGLRCDRGRIGHCPRCNSRTGDEEEEAKEKNKEQDEIKRPLLLSAIAV